MKQFWHQLTDTTSKKVFLIFGTLLVAAIIALVILLFTGKTHNTDKTVLYIHDGDLYPDVVMRLDELGVEPFHPTFRILSALKARSIGENYFRPGRYEIPAEMKLYDLVRKISNGLQDPTRLTLKKYRTKHQLCDYVSTQLNIYSEDLELLLNDSAYLSNYGLTTETALTLFLPNTYEVYWTISPEGLIERMKKESDRYWTKARLQSAEQVGITPTEVVILASIIEEETNQNDEKPLIASVYLNRLRRNMLLQADPTVKYAIGDFTLKRILKVHLEEDSPYNTYKYKGLPPGPICTPSLASINAVLENLDTKYLYFCAKADFSGHHVFAETLGQHNRNADLFHKALNERGL